MQTGRQMQREKVGAAPGGEGIEGMEMQGEGQTVLSASTYPQLRNAAVGSPVSGKWEGAVKSIEGDQVTVAYTKQDIETENSADKEYRKFTGQENAAPAEEDEGV